MIVLDHQGMGDQVIVFRQQSRFSFLYNWYWPSSFDRAREAERILLNLGDIKVPAKFEHQEHDPEYRKNDSIHLLHVDIGNNEYINTLKMDANGFTESCENKVNVVVCHGFGAGLGFFYKNFKGLMSIPSSRIFAIDWLGMGLSSRPHFPHSKPDSVDDV